MSIGKESINSFGNKEDIPPAKFEEVVVPPTENSPSENFPAYLGYRLMGGTTSLRALLKKGEYVLLKVGPLKSEDIREEDVCTIRFVKNNNTYRDKGPETVASSTISWLPINDEMFDHPIALNQTWPGKEDPLSREGKIREVVVRTSKKVPIDDSRPVSRINKIFQAPSRTERKILAPKVRKGAFHS